MFHYTFTFHVALWEFCCVTFQSLALDSDSLPALSIFLKCSFALRSLLPLVNHCTYLAAGFPTSIFQYCKLLLHRQNITILMVYYCKTYFHCTLISRFWNVEISLRFNLAFSRCSTSIHQAFDGQTEFSRVFNFAILSYSRNSQKFDARKKCVLHRRVGHGSLLTDPTRPELQLQLDLQTFMYIYLSRSHQSLSV